VAELASIRYRAFLSYSHRDAAWAKWLHKVLESYRVDKDLIGRDTPLGPVPETLRPIFRDREDFSGGHTLTDATIAALDASAALVGICSPEAATRPAGRRGGAALPLAPSAAPGDSCHRRRHVAG
jgi:MTH538 TIR-like domain (DUF1863)